MTGEPDSPGGDREFDFDPAERVQAVPPSGIRRFFEIAEERDDVISLGVGEPDFATPWTARDAAIDSLEQGKTSYTANRGMRELREAIAGYATDRFDLEYDPASEIIVTAGASEAVDLAFRAFVDPGDVVAIAQPSYISYEPGVTFAGGEVLSVPTREADEFRLTVEALEDAGAADAEVLVLCYPNNPTGAIMRKGELEPIAEFAREHDLLVLSDEIYAELTYEGDHTSIATLPGMRERTIVFNGFSKAHAMTGLRLGYALGPADAVAAMNKIHQYTMLSAPTTAQYAALEALESCGDEVRDMVDQYDRRRQFVLSRFREIGMDVFEAKGAFYCFPEVPEGWTGEAFAEELLREQGVAVVPGDVFGTGGERHLRVSYATGLGDLREALARIETFVDECGPDRTRTGSASVSGSGSVPETESEPGAEVEPER
ncbi:pyridoxal phosphate-dependent aminotransferase [Halobiforma nitratireducens]|uniref:Aminotransferase n=1 Tax=Halobiforma nitratireducens JCM 10879 TaxID=1227454 RepID=M0MJ65_9EURY|nr:aminotransferase class I/II-fold pyridoxal phosphate-dependent enzyme [Halobiforma nitratireducens]EMA45747.1 class I and II aminotransferase [Halobiforma nitratireducens JCM 10879]